MSAFSGGAIGMGATVGAALLGAALGLAPSAPAEAATSRLTLASSGARRTALVVERFRLKQRRRAAVIFLREGTRQGTLRTRRLPAAEEALRSRGTVFVYPEPLGAGWNPRAASPDVAFVGDLARRLVSDGLADPARIYVVGQGLGGMTALQAACSGAPVAGVVAMLTSLPAADAANCKPAAPTALMALVGTADAVVPEKGGKSSLKGFEEDVAPIESTLAPFLAVDRCGEARATNVLPDKDPKDGSRVAVDRWKGCARPVELVRVVGGGHSLPGRPRPIAQTGGAQNRDVDTILLIRDFLRRAGA